jgi:hypothetical protein
LGSKQTEGRIDFYNRPVFYFCLRRQYAVERIAPQFLVPLPIPLKQLFAILCLLGRRHSPWQWCGGIKPAGSRLSPSGGNASKHRAGAKLFAPAFVHLAQAAALCAATT